jgi:predicted TIM-barrel fold metal-dependent hydrolase
MSVQTDLPIFDADVHHHWSWNELGEYLPEGTRAPQYVGTPYPKVTGAFREDAVPPRGGLPCSDPEFAVEDYLNRYGIVYGLLSCGSTLGLGDLPDVDLAAAIARATNDWTIDRWFPVDERYLGAIVVCANDPDQAADEIRRLASNPRMVAVVINPPPTLLGQPFLHPIHEACAEAGLPLQLHPGTMNIRTGRPLGPATTMAEHRATMGLVGIQHLVSLVFEGVFVKYPGFRYVSNEWGTGWLPSMLWRLDMEYREHREEVPWLTKAPSEYIREHVRFTTQPVEEAQRPKDYVTLMELADSEELLLYASDYPHHDFDNPKVIGNIFPDEWRQRVFYDNAREWYGLDQRLGTVAPMAVAAT